MKDTRKTKARLLTEVAELRREVARLKEIEADCLELKHSAAQTASESEAVKALRASEQRLSLHVQQTPLAYIEWNVDFEVAEWNPAAETIFGYKKAEAMGRHAAGLIVPESVREIVDQVWADLLRQQGGTRSTNANVTRDGREIMCEWYNTPLVDENGDVIGVASLVQDVTERVQAEEELERRVEERTTELRALNETFRDSEERFRRVVSSISAHVYVTEIAPDGSQSNIYISPNIKALTGYSLERFSADWSFWPTTVIHPDDRDLAAEQAARLAGGLDSTTEYRLVRADGQVIWVQDSGRVAKDAETERLTIYGIVTDMTERKETEEELSKFKLAFERSGDAMFLTDIDGVILYVNKAFEEIYGFSAEEALGQTPRILKSGLIPHEVYQQFWQTLIAGQIVAGEIINKTKAGELINIEGNNNPIMDENGNLIGFLSIHRDISERKQAEEALLRLGRVVEQSLDGTAIADLDGNMQFVNTAWAKMHGYAVEDLQGKHLSIFHTEQQLLEEVEPFNTQVIQTGSHEGEVGHLRADGSTFSTAMTVSLLKDADDNPLGLAAVARDITESKAAEAERETLLAEVQRLAAIVENHPDFIGVGTLQGDAIYVNPAGLKMMGLPLDHDISSMNAQDFYSPEDAQTLLETGVPTALEKGSWTAEATLRRADGTTVPVEETLGVNYDAEGKPYSFSVTMRDITERKRAAENLARRAAEFETVALVSTAAASILEADRLLQEVVDLTKSRFNLYHAHIYVLNRAGDTLELTAGAGQIGRQMVAEGRRIPLQQEQSLVAQAARSKQGVIVNDVQQAANFLPHHLLPQTRAEMAIPMLVGDRLLGVLDVQADKVDYFRQEDQRIQTILANQVATALNNVRLLSRTETTLSEAQRLATIVENQTDFMGVSDLEGNALYINPAGLEMMGLPGDYDISALTIVDFFPADDAEVLINEGVPAAREQGAWTREAELLRVDGETIPVDKSVTVNYDADQQLYSFNIIMRNISARRAAEAEREALLAEVQATIRQYVHQQWEQFLGDFHQGNWRVQHQDPHTELADDEALLGQVQQTVLNRGQTQILAGGNGNGNQSHAALVSPIPLRGQVIGTLSLEDIDPDRDWSEDEIALVEAVSEQLALTIENLRLVENTQKRATREQLARHITDKMRAFPEADAIIQTGLDELAKALGVSRTYVKLNLNPKQGQE